MECARVVPFLGLHHADINAPHENEDPSSWCEVLAESPRRTSWPAGRAEL